MRILVVEDDDILRAFLKMVLVKKGYLVTLAASVEAGRREYDSHNYEFDLVLCGNDCPQRNTGRDWLKQLRAYDQRVLLTSGRGVEDLDGLPFLQQPSDLEELLAKITEVIAGFDPSAPPTS